MRVFSHKVLMASLALGGVMTGTAVADKPVDKGIGFQPSATTIMDETVFFHNDILMPIIIAISAFVGVLMLWIMIRYNKRANPTPAKWSHNTLLEIVWTAVPALIMLVIAIYSVQHVIMMEESHETDVTVKAIGHQWYWSYEYPDHDISMDAYMREEDSLSDPSLRLLETDTHIVIPSGTYVRLQVTSAPEDVIHSWTIPAFGVKVDAIPGRLNERYFFVHEGKEGMYYGQCSELCGARHAYMPINVKVVTRAEYDAWIGQQTAANGVADGNVSMAAAQ